MDKVMEVFRPQVFVAVWCGLVDRGSIGVLQSEFEGTR